MTETSATSVARTGITGLDDILRGGLPRGRMYLIEGDPGAGKTTLALQFLLEGARRGERVLYITLAETEHELRSVATSHGWSLDGVSIYGFTPAMPGAGDDDYSMFLPAEVELSETMSTLLAEVDRVKPSRVVFDSLSEIRLIAQHPLRYRRQLMALKQHFAGSDTTVLLLDDFVSTDATPDKQLQSLAHGVIHLEQLAPTYGGDRRRLRVKKLRALAFRGGYHDFAIETGGFVVFPRIVAGEHSGAASHERVSTGLTALDTLLGGGIDRGATTLLWGPAGCGKSLVATHCMLAAVARNERADAFLFDESIDSFCERSSGLDLPVEPAIERGALRLTPVDPAELSPGEFVHKVRQSVEGDGTRLLVIDSLNGYLSAMPEESFLIPHLHELFSYLNHKGVVTILIAAQHGLIGKMDSPFDVSYLADNVILLRYFEAAGRVRNAISVVKRRRGAHERTLRELSVQKGGAKIGDALDHFQGVLTGVPSYVGPLEALGKKAGA